LLNATVEWLQLMLCTREVPDSYLDPKVCYHAWGFFMVFLSLSSTRRR
jgi:hypothetical protein